MKTPFQHTVRLWAGSTFDGVLYESEQVYILTTPPKKQFIHRYYTIKTCFEEQYFELENQGLYIGSIDIEGVLVHFFALDIIPEKNSLQNVNKNVNLHHDQ